MGSAEWKCIGPGQPQDSLERLYLLAGLGMTFCPLPMRLKRWLWWGKFWLLCLDCCPVTQTLMDRWMKWLSVFFVAGCNLVMQGNEILLAVNNFFFLPSLTRWITKLLSRSTAAHQPTRRSPCPTSCVLCRCSAWLWTIWWRRSWIWATTTTGTGTTLSGTEPAASAR